MATNETLEKALAWMRSPEGKEHAKQYVAKMAAERKVREARLVRVGEWLKTNSFDELMARLEKEHGEEWSDKCWKKGYEKYPNNKMGLIVQYAREHGEEVDVSWIDKMFLGECTLFEGYVFATFCGQGCFHRIYKYDNQEALFDC